MIVNNELERMWKEAADDNYLECLWNILKNVSQDSQCPIPNPKQTYLLTYLLTYFVALVHKRTIPTERT
jgi:hypothetical protein